MKQYLLSVYQPDGNPASGRGPGEDHARARGAAGRDEGGRRVGLRRRPARRRARPPWCGSTDGDVLMTDGPFAEGKEHIGGFTDRQGTRPRRRARVGPPARPGGDRCRSRCARSRTRPRTDVQRAGRRRLGDRACLPRGVRPRGGRPGPRLRRHRHRRGGGPGRVHRGGAALAGRRAAPEPGRLDHHHRPQPRDRPAPPRGVPRRPARPGRPAARPRRAAGGGRRARRPAAPDLHLLPPGARHRARRSR